MKKTSLLILLLFFGVLCYAKGDGRQFLGINIFQLPTSTLNLNYSKEIHPCLTAHIDVGYTIDYVSVHESDFLGKYLTDHHSNIDYPFGSNTHNEQSGGYLKLGTFFNVRRTFTQASYFRLGLFITNSIVYEDHLVEGDMMMLHTLYVPGVSVSCGYELKISSRFKASFDYQLSSSIFKNDLSTNECFVPGMGLSGKGANLYPMVLLNIKYELQ